MTHVLEATVDQLQLSESPSLLKRLFVFGYGVLAYNIGVGGLLWIILAMGGLAPVGFSPLHTDNTVMALFINSLLILLFGLQHSIMARAGFKQHLQRVIPTAAERSTYVLLSGLFMAMAIYFWQPIPGYAWQVENTVARYVLWAAYALGWGYLFIATFVTNHFELMGLRQVYLYLADKPYSKLPFTRKYMYRYSRHPMMLGILVGMWALPTMSISHFIMSCLLTLYVAAGVALEERDLIKQFGTTYREYKQQIAAFLPGIF